MFNQNQNLSQNLSQNLYNPMQSNLLNNQSGLQSNFNQPTFNGNLVIRPLEATLTHNTELIGKMSPYLKLILGNESKTSAVAKKQHKNPTWDQELVFRYHGEQSLRCEVWHKELLGDDLVGYGTLDLGNLLRQGQFMGDVPLFYKDKDAGFLRLSMNFFEDGSPYNPFTSQQMAKQSGFIGGATMGQSVNALPSQSVLAGSTLLGTGVETTFLPTQTNLSTARTTVVQQPVLVQENLEPIVHKETQRLFEQPVYIHQRPVVHEKTVIIEKPIITEKTIIEREIPIIKEMCELHEKTYYQKQAPVLIRENPIVRKEELSTSLDRLTLEGEPIITRQTELKREVPQYFQERAEVFDKEVIHEKPIIHEKDIIFVEKPIHIEKPEILEKPVITSGGSQTIKEGLVRREVVLTDDLTIPNEAITHTDRVVLKEPATFFKERPEIFEKEVIVERPILYEQPVIFTEKQEIHEKAEFIEKRGRRIEAPIVERSDIVLVRADNNDLLRQQQSNLTTGSRLSGNLQQQQQQNLSGSNQQFYDVA